MSQESLNVERLAGRYGFLERTGLLPLPSIDGITLVVELSRPDCAAACLPLLLLHSGESVRIIAVAMTPDFPMETLAGQFSQEQSILFVPYEKEEYMPNQALAQIETSFAVLLEDSTMVSPGWLNELLWVPFDDASVKVVAPRSSTERGEGKKRLHFGTYDEFAAHVSYSLSRHQGEWREMDVLTGSCLLFSKELLQRIGGLDTSLHARPLMIADWCLRARQSGAKLALSDAVYVHAIHSLDRGRSRLNGPTLADGWRAYSTKWALQDVLEDEEHLVPQNGFLQSTQPVIPLGKATLATPLVTAIVYCEEDGNGDHLPQEWAATQEQQSYKNIRWIWIKDSWMNTASGVPVNEQDVVITVRGQEAWLRALKNASALFESEITVYLSDSIRYEKYYVERVVKAITQGSADLIVSLSTDMDEEVGHLLKGDPSGIVFPLERVAHKGGNVPGVITCKASTSHQLQLHPEASLTIGYVGDLSEPQGKKADSSRGREAHS
ncbi:hypothetical protein [Paenibacillus odorifer]|uniref:hypothetical protein n=1 Tax=Paenibacillus TaxID=44249 RepID=UPI00096BEEE0|nr:hypothetical protein [Paenibacillus odorifer]OMC97830.1 hypothetical protein BJP46_25415 [Paenibacillus odorifer]